MGTLQSLMSYCCIEHLGGLLLVKETVEKIFKTFFSTWTWTLPRPWSPTWKWTYIVHVHVHFHVNVHVQDHVGVHAMFMPISMSCLCL
jgi:hypothetical protein